MNEKIKDINTLKNFNFNEKIFNTFELKKIKFGLVQFDSMTFNEFIDCQYFFKEANWAGLLSIIYRPIIKADLINYEIEKYEIKRSEVVAEWMNNISIIFFSSIIAYSKWVNELYLTYSSIFDSWENEDTEKEDDEIKNDKPFIYYWYSLFFQISDGNIEKIEKMMESNIHSLLTFLSFSNQNNSQKK